MKQEALTDIPTHRELILIVSVLYDLLYQGTN